MKLTKFPASLLVLFAATVVAIGPAQPSNVAKVRLHLRTQIRPFHNSNQLTEANFESTIIPSRTAIIITDMWDKHWCRGATERVGQIAERMEPVLERARKTGILIIHSPSDTMDFYANTPGRLLAEKAPRVSPPPDLAIEDGPLPIDDSNGGCDTPGDKYYQAWKRENPRLKVGLGDVISDDGGEIYNVLREYHIDTILYMGVHANMCILNRTFGVRKMSRWGLRCIIVRDLLDAMYEPSSRPFVGHAAGTELVCKFIEQYWAPSVTSKDLIAGLDTIKPVSKH